MRKWLTGLLRLDDRGARGRRHRLFCLCCVLLIALCLGYVLSWSLNRQRVLDASERYAALYSPAPLSAASPAVPTQVASAAPTQVASAAPTQVASAAPTQAASAVPTQAAVAVVDATLAPLATPDENTLIVALPTLPPAQESFAELLLYNPDTIGYLTIGEVVNLPVVQRENDNEYYLNHSFAREQADEGALFLDGANRLTDKNLIIYGHNMRNGTMFGRLSEFGRADFVRKNAVVRFDTLYENALYVPFAMFEASMDEADAHYFDVRRIVFDQDSFDLFVQALRARSALELPVDVAYGDQLLTLVTCSYNDADGRYIVALRRLRQGETEAQMRALIAEAL